MITERPSRQQRSRSRKGNAVRALIAVLLLVLAFLLGIAFARTLDERPEPGGTVTTVRTLAPTAQSAPTVTVTVTSP